MTVLLDEITNDPLARGYSGMTDAQVAASLGTANITRIKASMTGNALFVNTVAAEFTALAAAKQQMWVSFCAGDGIDPGNAANVAFVTFIFGAGAATLTALNTARNETVSRATQLGLPFVNEQMVREVRAHG